MPRKPRFFMPGMPVHTVRRGHSLQAVFFEDNDYLAYLRRLKDGAERYKVDIHAYVLMTNHIHLLAMAEIEIAKWERYLDSVTVCNATKTGQSCIK